MLSERWETEKKSLEQANSKFHDNFSNDFLTLTHSFFDNPTGESYQLINEYVAIENKLNSLNARSLKELLNQKEDLYAPLLLKQERSITSSNFEDSKNEYLKYLRMKSKYPDGESFYQELEFASEVMNDLVMIIISYLNKPKDDNQSCAF